MSDKQYKANETLSEKAIRRFSVHELCVWITAFCLSLGVLRTAYLYSQDQTVPYKVSVLAGWLAIFAFCVLCACPSALLGFLICGRRGVFTAVIVGGLLIPASLYVLVAIYVYNAHG